MLLRCHLRGKKKKKTLLHKTETIDPPPEESSSDHSNIAECTINNHSPTSLKGFTYLQKIPVILKNGSTSTQTNAILDIGPDMTLIQRKMVDHLKLKTSFKENFKIFSKSSIV